MPTTNTIWGRGFIIIRSRIVRLIFPKLFFQSLFSLMHHAFRTWLFTGSLNCNWDRPDKTYQRDNSVQYTTERWEADDVVVDEEYMFGWMQNSEKKFSWLWYMFDLRYQIINKYTITEPKLATILHHLCLNLACFCCVFVQRFGGILTKATQCYYEGCAQLVKVAAALRWTESFPSSTWWTPCCKTTHSNSNFSRYESIRWFWK